MQQPQNNSLLLENKLLQLQLQQLQQYGVQGPTGLLSNTSADTGQIGTTAGPNSLNVRLHVDNAASSSSNNLPPFAPPQDQSSVPNLSEEECAAFILHPIHRSIKLASPSPNSSSSKTDTHSAVTAWSTPDTRGSSSGWLAELRMDDRERALAVRGKVHLEEEPHNTASIHTSPGQVRLRRASHNTSAPIMLLDNVPLSQRHY